ncbi:MAG: nitrite reductase (NAD(P)H) small subunit [Acidobacteria bacterium]|nr:nitrite reductase (NAD(P)H) small subunit [Acidobacteriota bacterium]
MADDKLDELLRVLEMYSFDEGRNRIVEALACDVEGEVHAFRDRCPSGGRALEGWRRDGRTITCACHGHRFDLSSGRCLDKPELALEVVPVRIDNTAVMVAL